MTTPRRFEGVARVVAHAVSRSPFRSPSRWPLAVVTFDNAKCSVTSRGELAARFRQNDLAALANETMARRVPRGSILLWAITDAPDGGFVGTGFHVFDIATGEAARC